LPDPSPGCEHLFVYVLSGIFAALSSDGHAYTRLRRVLETRSSALLIRAAAAELPAPVPLEDALDICLALLELEPHTYPQTATRWGSRLAIERKLNLVDAQLAFAALSALPGLSAKAGAEALIEISGRHGLRRVEGLLLAWLERRGLGE
jgi:hypothetical protein